MSPWRTQMRFQSKEEVRGRTHNCLFASSVLGGWPLTAQHLCHQGSRSSHAGCAVIGVRFVVFEMNATSHIDSQGAHTIMEIARSLRARGVQLLLSNPNRQVGRAAMPAPERSFTISTCTGVITMCCVAVTTSTVHGDDAGGPGAGPHPGGSGGASRSRVWPLLRCRRLRTHVPGRWAST